MKEVKEDVTLSLLDFGRWKLKESHAGAKGVRSVLIAQCFMYVISWLGLFRIQPAAGYMEHCKYII